ncbi:probable N-acetyltransferase HLS1 [Diospyros lotus]|uniref:probable N-acetyltransferase HLS1 n=1 Tax=Diospyros lotus TaxID=55363 RepID=UPI00224D247C|nr:probable N-acetyltransferase HLS1 [Diospyros lotus]
MMIATEMSSSYFKVAAESFPAKEGVAVRRYDEERDKVAVEELEQRCEVGPPGKPSLLTDLMGDPICRVRNFPSHVMLVAEYGEGKAIVGVIRGCIKTVTNGRMASGDHDLPSYVRLAYILGLRVSPAHRKLGIATKLVESLEEWCKQNGAEYAYMATECSNEASLNLFTVKCKYIKFRRAEVMVQPVHAHYKPLGSGIKILKVPQQLALSIYSQIFAKSEFFPEDMDRILTNKLNLGTFLAVPSKSPGISSHLPSGPFAILSVWNTKQVFRLQVKGVSRLTSAWCAGSRAADALLPWLGIPSVPDLFTRQFGVYFLYGLHMEGYGASRLMKSLCAFAHNMAKDDDGCAAIVAEVGPRDPVRLAVPHWPKFSWSDDVWCIKKLIEKGDHGCGPLDWIKSQASSDVIFVDPRDF